MSPHPAKVDGLGLAPPVDSVGAWFESAGFARRVVGKSLEGRDLAVFVRTVPPRGGTDERREEGAGGGAPSPPPPPPTSVLFLSLVRGNEPLGLLALLHTAEDLLRPSAVNRHRLSPGGVRLIFFPIVNVDGYALNLRRGGGCRGTNLNRTCRDLPADDVDPCPVISRQGVDLNRQFDPDRAGDRSAGGDADDAAACSSGGDYPGAAPFSEPESRAVRDVVMTYRPAAAMSFHGRRSDRRPLIVYPFCSEVHREMEPGALERYRRWSDAMSSRRGLYATGNASETVGYTASGVAIDWMHESANVTAFAHESGTPCGERWCGPEHAPGARDDARVYARAGVKMVDLALDLDEARHALSPLLALAVVVVGTAIVWASEKGRGGWVLRARNSLCRRRRREKKNEQEVELQGFIMH